MKRQKLNLHFYPRGNWIHARVYIKDTDLRISTDIEVIPGHWDKIHQRIPKKHPEAEDTNTRIATFSLRVSDAHAYAIKNGRPFTRQFLAEWLREDKKPDTPDFYALLWKSLNDRAHQIGKGTYDTYKAQITKLQQFAPKLELQQFNEGFLLKYEKHLLTSRDNNKNTVQKSMSIVKRLIKPMVKQKLLQENPFEDMVFKGTKSERIRAMEIPQLRAIENYHFASKPVYRAARLYLLQCYTAMAYKDLKTFTPEYIFTDGNGRKWASKSRSKSDTDALFPIFPRAERILHQLGFYEEGKLPVPALQGYNDLLKEVAQILDINVRLSTHVGRKTCGMLMLNAGVPIEVVSRILGHTKIATTQQFYARMRRDGIEKGLENFDLFD